MADATVKFNVGGKRFEVSRALIDGHADTVLGRLVSETWNDAPDEAVFIDRSGDLFAHVLEYLRYGSVELPITVPRSMFDRELDYYGIAPAEDCVTTQGNLADITKLFAVSFAKAKKKYTSFFLARECYSQFWNKNIKYPTQNIGSVSVAISKDHALFNDGELDRKLFDEYLGRYFGLKVPKGNCPNLYGNYFDVSLKE